ncbi:MAG TPA: M23 family metallopeptidase [Polyangia bacterium]|nr:M23 family metallopeptidase [Polyangia bacterium]
MKRACVVAAIVGAFVLLVTHRTAWALARNAAPVSLRVPVAGVARSSLRSSFGEPRSEHRRHQGIDIFAKRGTPVVAACRGEVVRIGRDRLGGNVVWVAGGGARLYYYAHLQSFRPGLAVGERVDGGDVLGRVGTTGNARGTPPHLHFGVYPAAWAFRAVDPAPLLRQP